MRETVRKAIMLFIAFLCLIMSVIGGLLPFLQGWVFFAIALAILAKESKIARDWIRVARRRWPGLSRHLTDAAAHRRAPRALQNFVRQTDPGL
jgi:uncharacterized membrane protein YbaN (DUF454 family)